MLVKLVRKKYYRLFYWQQKTFERIRLRKRVKQKIRLLKRNKDLIFDKSIQKKAAKTQQKYFRGYKKVYSHLYFSMLNGIQSEKYLSSEVFFTLIEPALNPYELTPAFADKSAYDLFFDKDYLPRTLFKIIDGRFYNENNNFVETEKAFKKLTDFKNEMVFKPALQSGAGKNVFIGNGKTLIEKIKSVFKKGSFVIQEKFEQHEKVAKFHPASTNTCRIFTARIQSEIVFLGAVFRTGKNNSRVDNGGSGGIMCFVNQNGICDEFGIDQQNVRYYKHPNTKVSYKNFKVPGFEKALEFCLKNHLRFIRFTLISWDLGIQKNGEPIFIEMNLQRQAIKTYQILRGPIFADYLEYFSKEVKKNVFIK